MMQHFLLASVSATAEDSDGVQLLPVGIAATKDESIGIHGEEILPVG